MARITENGYRFSVWERFVESKIWKRFYNASLPSIQFEPDGSFLKYDIELNGKKHSFWIEKNGLQEYELQSCYIECFENYRINGHAYLRPEMAIHEGDVIVDAGGCEGYFTRYALDQGAKKVILLEPCERLARGLERTFEKDIAVGNVILIKKGLGNKRGEEELIINENMYCASNVNYIKDTCYTGRETVHIDTLDHLLSEISGGEQINLIKMDIEGAEMEALEGAAATIKEYRPRMMIATYHGYENAMLCRDIVLRSEGGYHVKVCGRYPEGTPVRPYMTLFF